MQVVTCDRAPGMQPDVVCPAEHLPFGNGSFDNSSAGNTTVFIGDEAGRASGAYTPWDYTDYPCAGRDKQHERDEPAAHRGRQFENSIDTASP